MMNEPMGFGHYENAGANPNGQQSVDYGNN